MSWLPSPIVLASIGFGTYVVTVGLVAVITAWWLVLLARWSWRRLRPSRRARRRQAAPKRSPGPELPKRIPGPPRMTPRPDLDAAHAALAAQVQRLNGAIDEALTGRPAPVLLPARDPKRREVRRLLKGATQACRDAANNTSKGDFA